MVTSNPNLDGLVFTSTHQSRFSSLWFIATPISTIVVIQVQPSMHSTVLPTRYSICVNQQVYDTPHHAAPHCNLSAGQQARAEDQQHCER